MVSNFVTISIVGLLAGFIFSVPVAGPISILITSNALKGKFWYSLKAAIGASFADFFYVFISMLGLTHFYELYKLAIPYILMAGAVFVFIIGYRITKTQLKAENLNDDTILKSKYHNRGGFRTGLFLNFLNPTLFFGWLSSTFITFSLVASLGFNMGGLEDSFQQSINAVDQSLVQKPSMFSPTVIDSIPPPQQSTALDQPPARQNTTKTRWYHYTLSALYAFFVSIGSISWFYLFVSFLVKNRHRINIKMLTNIIRTLGYILIGISFYLLGRGIDLLT